MSFDYPICIFVLKYYDFFSLQLVHRTLAAILGSLAAIAVLSLFDKVSIKKNEVVSR